MMGWWKGEGEGGGGVEGEDDKTKKKRGNQETLIKGRRPKGGSIFEG